MKKTAAIVTLYYPKGDITRRMTDLSGQVTALILSDNTPDGNNAALFANIPNAVYLANGANLGLSAALNRGLATPEAQDSDYVFFFDQDSAVPPKHIEIMVRDWEMLEKDHRIGLLGPSYFDEITETMDADSAMTPDDCTEPYRSIEQMITSSMMSQYNIMRQIDFWNEEIFLDYADYDLCWRLLRADYELFITRNTQMRHKLGEGFVWAFDLISRQRFKLAYGAPIRRYYQTRASVKLLRSGYVPKAWTKWLWLNLTLRRYFELVYLPDKWKMSCYHARGIWDGLRGKCGELSAKQKDGSLVSRVRRSIQKKGESVVSRLPRCFNKREPQWKAQ